MKKMSQKIGVYYPNVPSNTSVENVIAKEDLGVITFSTLVFEGTSGF